MADKIDPNFDSKLEIVVLGAMLKHKNANADRLREEIEKVMGGKYAVITYKSRDAERGNAQWMRTQGYWVFVKKLIEPDDYDRDEVQKFMTREFKWASIRDVGAFQKSAYSKINERFSGDYKVHVVKNRSDADYVFEYTLLYEQEDYGVYITKW